MSDEEAPSSHAEPNPDIALPQTEREEGEAENPGPGSDSPSNDAQSASEDIQAQSSSPSGSENDRVPDLASPMSPEELRVRSQIVSVVGGPESEAGGDSNAKSSGKRLSNLSEYGSNRFLSESSRRTATTARDVSSSVNDVAGTRTRLSQVSQPTRLASPSSLRESLFGRAKKKKRRTASAPAAAPIDTIIDLERGSLSVPQEVQSIYARSGSGDDSVAVGSLSDDESHLNHEEQFEREEREHFRRQIVFCVLFTVLLFGGLGITITLQILRTSE